MPRTSRQQSSTGIYHIMLRGINRQSIFEDEEDKLRFVDILRLCKEPCGYEIFAWCLMDNHVHLVIRFTDKPIDVSIKKIGIKYAYYFNRKYERSGHLMQDRFKSETIEDNAYLYTVVRYVHMNPVKAGICDRPEVYKWSSFRQYLFDAGVVHTVPVYRFADTESVLEMFGADEFVKFAKAGSNDICLEIEEPYGGRRMSDEKARTIMSNVTGCKNSSEFQRLGFAERRFMFIELYDAKLNVLQISRLTGISRSVIIRAKRKGGTLESNSIKEKEPDASGSLKYAP